MTTPHTSYYSNNSSESFNWPGSLSLAMLAFTLSLVFGAYLQLVEVLFGETLGFGALTFGLLGVGLGLLAGVRRPGFRRARSQATLGSAIVVQALGLYLLSGWLVNSQLDSTLMYLIVISPLVLTVFFIASLASVHLIPHNETSSAGLEAPIAVIVGLAFGVLINSIGADTIGAPVLLLAGGGVLICLPMLAGSSACSARLRIVPLALVGVFAFSFIAQVLLNREELRSIDHLVLQEQSETVANKLLWTYGPAPLIATDDVRVDKPAFALMGEVFDDSLSVLLVEGAPEQLEGIASLNCSEVTIINHSPLRTFATEKTIARRFESDKSHTFQTVKAEAFDFIANAQRRWDVIYLPGNSSTGQLDALQSDVQETREFYTSCLTHLAEGGFVIFETGADVSGEASSLALFQRLTGFSAALRLRGVNDPASCFVALPGTESGTYDSRIILIFSERPPEAMLRRVRAFEGSSDSSDSNDNRAVELLACFLPGVELNLSDQYDIDLTHVTLARPFPHVLPPTQFGFAQPVHASALGGLRQTSSSGLYDALSSPVAELSEEYNVALGAALAVFVGVLGLAFALGRKVISHTALDRRRRERRAFLLFALSLAGFMIVIVPAIMEQGLRAGGLMYFPEQVRVFVLLVSIGAGLWLSARRRYRSSYRAEVGLTGALLLSLVPAVLLDLTSPAYLGALVSFVISPALFGAVVGAFLRREKILVSPGAVPLLSALLFAGIAAMLFARLFSATFGFGSTMELGLLALALTVVLQLLHGRAAGKAVRS